MATSPGNKQKYSSSASFGFSSVEHIEEPMIIEDTVGEQYSNGGDSDRPSLGHGMVHIALPTSTMISSSHSLVTPRSPSPFSMQAYTLVSSAQSSPQNMLPDEVTIKLEQPLDLSDCGSPSSSGACPTPNSPDSMQDFQEHMPTKKSKKGNGVAGKSIEEEICLICGDRASGYHYNALSCEGCKGFFRRSITRSADYKCKHGGNCEMDMWMRRRCQYCRLRRCREVGMKEECLLSDDQCKARDVRRKARQKIQKLQMPELPDSQEAPDSNSSQRSISPEPVLNPLEHMTGHAREMVEKLVLYQDEFELPRDEDMQKISGVRISTAGRPRDLSEAIYKHMAEMTILTTQLVVEFAKRLPGFPTLEREDQIQLLKGSACEIMMLRTARRYDVETDTVVFANGMPFTKDNLRFAGLNDYVESMFHFCKGMGIMGVDNAEYALLTALCIFQEREGVLNPQKLEAVQDIYVNVLIAYEQLRRPRSSNFLAKLLMKLTELRQLSVEYSDVLFSLKVEKGSLPPLLSEYFDVAE